MLFYHVLGYNWFAFRNYRLALFFKTLVTRAYCIPCCSSRMFHKGLLFRELASSNETVFIHGPNFRSPLQCCHTLGRVSSTVDQTECQYMILMRLCLQISWMSFLCVHHLHLYVNHSEFRSEQGQMHLQNNSILVWVDGLNFPTDVFGFLYWVTSRTFHQISTQVVCSLIFWHSKQFSQVILLLIFYESKIRGINFELVTCLDNQAAEGILAAGFTQLPVASKIIRVYHQLTQLSGAVLTPVRTSSKDNSRADDLSRGVTFHEEPSNQFPLDILPLLHQWFSAKPTHRRA